MLAIIHFLREQGLGRGLHEGVLAGAGEEADTDSNGRINMHELMVYMSDHLPRLTSDKVLKGWAWRFA